MASLAPEHFRPLRRVEYDQLVALGTFEGEDGLPGKEGCFVICSFWLVKALAYSGRVQEAEEIFIKLLDFISPLGLYAEEVDPETGTQQGNFPQAFSHVGLINSALYLEIAKGKQVKGPQLFGY
jgi:GH15 family glucan-1,4-alpha-glucosidase